MGLDRMHRLARAGYPMGAAPLCADSGIVANAVAAATLAKAAGQCTFLSGFSVTGTGATAAGAVEVTVTGVVGGPLSYTVAVPAGANVGLQPLVVPFYPPLPASGDDVDIVVSVPALGAGNTRAAVVATGFRL